MEQCISCSSELAIDDLTPLELDRKTYYICDACLDAFPRNITAKQILEKLRRA